MVGRDLRLPNWQVLKNMLASEGDTRDASSIPRLGRSPGVGNANPLQYSCLENSMDVGAWLVTAHWVTELDRLSDFTHSQSEAS